MSNADLMPLPPIASWLKELKFYENEIVSCERSLEEIVTNTRTSKDLILAEQFQNQFILQRYNLRRLKHQLKWLAQAPREALQILIGEVQYFIKLFKSLLHEFDHFMAPYFHLTELPKNNHPA